MCVCVCVCVCVCCVGVCPTMQCVAMQWRATRDACYCVHHFPPQSVRGPSLDPRSVQTVGLLRVLPYRACVRLVRACAFCQGRVLTPGPQLSRLCALSAELPRLKPYTIRFSNLGIIELATGFRWALQGEAGLRLIHRRGGSNLDRTPAWKDNRFGLKPKSSTPHEPTKSLKVASRP